MGRPSAGGRFAFIQRSKVMSQTELNRQVAQQLGESISEIARRGFSLVEPISNESGMTQFNPDAVLASAAA